MQDWFGAISFASPLFWNVWLGNTVPLFSRTPRGCLMGREDPHPPLRPHLSSLASFSLSLWDLYLHLEGKCGESGWVKNLIRSPQAWASRLPQEHSRQLRRCWSLPWVGSPGSCEEERSDTPGLPEAENTQPASWTQQEVCPASSQGQGSALRVTPSTYARP